MGVLETTTFPEPTILASPQEPTGKKEEGRPPWVLSISENTSIYVKFGEKI
jgi:hypothetical protein